MAERKGVEVSVGQGTASLGAEDEVEPRGGLDGAAELADRQGEGRVGKRLLKERPLHHPEVPAVLETGAVAAFPCGVGEGHLAGPDVLLPLLELGEGLVFGQRCGLIGAAGDGVGRSRIFDQQMGALHLVQDLHRCSGGRGCLRGRGVGSRWTRLNVWRSGGRGRCLRRRWRW